MTDRTPLLSSSRLAIRIFIGLNLAFAGAIAVGLVCSLLFGDKFTRLLLSLDTSSGVAAATAGVRWVMIVGLLAAGATQLILHLLGQMAGSVAAGDPFAAANAARLRRIGWALLFIQLLDFPVMAIRHYFPVMDNAVPDAGLSLSGWLAVLMVFLLAQVFEKGTDMRDFLEETI